MCVLIGALSNRDVSAALGGSVRSPSLRQLTTSQSDSSRFEPGISPARMHFDLDFSALVVLVSRLKCDCERTNTPEQSAEWRAVRQETRRTLLLKYE